MKTMASLSAQPVQLSVSGPTPSSTPTSNLVSPTTPWKGKNWTHADLSESRSKYRARVRRRKAEQEDGREATERTGFDQDPEDGEAGSPDTVHVPFDGLPESIPNHQRRSALRRYREAPCREQPVVDARKKDGAGRGEVREINEGCIASDCCTKS